MSTRTAARPLELYMAGCPILRMRAELRGRRVRVLIYSVGLRPQYRSDQVLQRHIEDFRWRKLKERPLPH
jgi:hypothetical protein